MSLASLSICHSSRVTVAAPDLSDLPRSFWGDPAPFFSLINKVSYHLYLPSLYTDPLCALIHHSIFFCVCSSYMNYPRVLCLTLLASFLTPVPSLPFFFPLPLSPSPRPFPSPLRLMYGTLRVSDYLNVVQGDATPPTRVSLITFQEVVRSHFKGVKKCPSGTWRFTVHQCRVLIALLGERLNIGVREGREFLPFLSYVSREFRSVLYPTSSPLFLTLFVFPCPFFYS